MPRPVLLYDAGCRVCRFVARTIVRLDRRRELAVLPLQDHEAARFLERLPAEERLASWRLVRPDGSLVGYGAGTSELLGSMWLTRWLGRAVATARTVPSTRSTSRSPGTAAESVASSRAARRRGATPERPPAAAGDRGHAP